MSKNNYKSPYHPDVVNKFNHHKYSIYSPSWPEPHKPSPELKAIMKNIQTDTNDDLPHLEIQLKECKTPPVTDLELDIH